MGNPLFYVRHLWEEDEVWNLLEYLRHLWRISRCIPEAPVGGGGGVESLSVPEAPVGGAGGVESLGVP